MTRNILIKIGVCALGIIAFFALAKDVKAGGFPCTAVALDQGSYSANVGSTATVIQTGTGTCSSTQIQDNTSGSYVIVPATDVTDLDCNGETCSSGPSSSQTRYLKCEAAGTYNIRAYNSTTVISSVSTVTCNAADVTAPTVSTLSPADNATAVGINDNLVITFSEAVDAEAGANNDIVIKKTSDNSTIETIDSQDAKVTGSGTAIITINPAATLSGETSYYVQIGADAFDDAAGNSYAGIADTTTWNFTTADVTSPTVSSVAVQTGSTVNVVFSEAMGTGVTIASNYTVSGTGKGTLASNPTSAALVSGNTYVLTWSSGEMFNAGDITITVANAQDLAGNAIAAPNNSGTHTGGGIGVAPTVSITSPTTGSKVNASKVITFTNDETTSPQCSVDNSNWTTCTSNTTTLGDISQFAGITEGNTFTLYLKDTDAAGNTGTNNVANITKDTTAPTFVVQYYSDSDLTATITDNSKIKAGTYYVKISANEALGSTPTVSIAAEGTANDVTNGATTLVSGNDYKYTRIIATDAVAIGSVIEDWSVTGTDSASNTATNVNPTNEATKAMYTDTTAPTVSTLSPANNATAVATTANLILTFSKAVDAESGNITIKKASDNSTFETIDVTSGNVTGSGTAIITINPTGTFAEQTGYYVQIDTTAFDDAAGNSYAGITDTTTWNFTIGDFTAPTVSTLSPADNAPSIAIDSNLVITFSEAVDAETGNINLYKTAGDVLVQAFNVATDITGTGTNTITINPTSNLLGETAYYVKIDATAFDDAASNSFAGIADTTTWNFTTADITSPAISSGLTSGEQSAGTTSVTMSVTTNENATCKYSSTSGTAFALMTAFTTTDTTSHSTSISGLSNGSSYSYYVLCQDSSNNESTETTISFSVASVVVSGGGGGGGGFSPPYPRAPEGGYVFLITPNPTTNGYVTLHFGGGQDITRIQISENISFSPATYIDYVTSVTWIFQSAGDKTLYAKFCNQYARCGETVMAKVMYAPPLPPQENTPPNFIENIIPNFIKKKPLPEPQVKQPIVKQEVTTTPPQSLGGDWELLSNSLVYNFVLAPLPNDIAKLTAKFPELGKVFARLGIIKISDLEKLKNTNINLPVIANKKEIPPEILVAEGGRGNITIGSSVALTTTGEVQQKIETIAGKPIVLSIKPESPAESIKGYLLFKRKPEKTAMEVSLNSLVASVILARAPVAQISSETPTIERELLVHSFEYTDPDGDGIFTAEISTPEVEGEYEVLTVINYKDKEKGSKELRMITVVDPEGYVYKTNNGEETRISNVNVSIFSVLNGTTSLWDALKYNQDNPQITDNTGKYSFLVLPGKYYITAEAKGYKSYKGDEFDVKEGAGVHFNIEMMENGSWFKALVDWKMLIIIIFGVALLVNFINDRRLRKQLSIK